MKADPRSLEERAGQLLTDVQDYLHTRERELALPLGTSADILVAALTARICETAFAGTNPPQLIWDAGSRECTLRLADVTFSMKDWVERKVPWRWQSSEMKERAKDLTSAPLRNGRLDS